VSDNVTGREPPPTGPSRRSGPAMILSEAATHAEPPGARRRPRLSLRQGRGAGPSVRVCALVRLTGRVARPALGPEPASHRHGASR
jgi:hypothetical protein